MKASKLLQNAKAEVEAIIFGTRPTELPSSSSGGWGVELQTERRAE